MARSSTVFSLATLAPVVLLMMAGVWGGLWVVAACLYLTLFSFAMDELVRFSTHDISNGSEFPAADRLSVVLAVSHFALLALGIWALAGGTGLSGFERLGVFVAFGLFFGQISNSNAHELIHRQSRARHNLGKWVYISLLFGHHTSAHLQVHHRFVSTDEDPNSARLGESFYTFALRAWRGSFVAGYEMESQRLLRNGKPRTSLSHPYVTYVMAAFAFVFVTYALAGFVGVLAYVGLCSYAQMQLLLSDYVQHYGLSRRIQPSGKPEPVSSMHSWDAPHWFTGHMMLNAPRHADHHANPSKPFPMLELSAENTTPTLPRGLPAMAAIALWPRLWRRVMDPRARALQRSVGSSPDPAKAV